MSGLYAWPSLPCDFTGNKSFRIVIRVIFAVLKNCEGQYISILIKLPNNDIAQNLELQDGTLAECDQWRCFFKMPKFWFFLRCSHGKQSVKAPYRQHNCSVFSAYLYPYFCDVIINFVKFWVPWIYFLDQGFPYFITWIGHFPASKVLFLTTFLSQHSAVCREVVNDIIPYAQRCLQHSLFFWSSIVLLCIYTRIRCTDYFLYCFEEFLEQ